MPLLNRKRVPLTQSIPYDPKRKRKEVWYLRFTNEVFTSYESYIEKLSLYHQAIWECEATGRQNLTYEQALESEKTEQDRMEHKFCLALKRIILNRVQFQTMRLDDLVDHIFSYLQTHYHVDEIVQCNLNGYDYFAKIIELLPTVQQYRPQWIKPQTLDQNSKSGTSNEVEVPRQPNGRLRFPDAFLHPNPESFTPSEPDPTIHIQCEKESLVLVEIRQYKVQLIDHVGQPLEDCTRIVGEDQIKRDKQSFNRLNIQRFIRECTFKEGYLNAPWLIKPSIAATYNLDNRLPAHLQEAYDHLFVKPTNKKRKLLATKTAHEKEAEKRARREENMLQKAKLKEERDRLREERKKQAAVKYPLEDLDLPVYRKDPNRNWALIDMSPQTYDCKQSGVIPYPSGGKPIRPLAHYDSPIPPNLFDSFLSIWAFLTVFSEPLKLTAYSVDDFERALFHTSHQPKATVLIEYNACLLNAIISERKEDTANEIINGDAMENYIESLEEQNPSDDHNSNDEREDEYEGEDEDPGNDKNRKVSKLKPEQFALPSVLPRVERGWRDQEHLRFSKKWDNKELRANYERRGWETSLIGCLNDVATPDLLPDVDDLLRHLVPKMNSTAVDREKQYATLSVKQKLDILGFLVDVVNESTLIKNYMEYCQDQLSEFRKQRVELNKELKALIARRIEMDKRDKAEKSEETSDDDEESSSDDSCDHPETTDIESDSSESRIVSRGRRHQSRQEKLKQKQKERQERETQRKKQYAEQRQVAKAKSHEQRIKASERRKLEEDERLIKKKEEHLDKCMRRYTTLRIRPLGKDRFNNRYIYLDNIGVSNTCGSGRLYVNSPSDGDIQVMMERDFTLNLPQRPWGYGGGRWFIKKLMRDQGLLEESEWLEKRMDELNTDQPSEYQGWWKYYSDTEEIDQLLAWLNPKGSRELKLKNELLKQHNNIIDSIKKRTQALAKTESVSKRTTRAKSIISIDSWDKS